MKDLISINKVRNKKFFKYFAVFTKNINSFPLIYLIIIYSFALTKWVVWNQKSIFLLWSGGEHLAEHIQFIFYLSSTLISFLNILKNKYRILSLQNLCWIFFAIFTLFLAIEEVSHLNTMQGGIFDFIRANNTHNQINLHNHKFVQPYLHPVFILLNFFFGWIGWKYFSFIDAIPDKVFFLYFLFPAIAIALLGFRKFGIYLPIHQEIFEFLMAMGLLLNGLKQLKKYSKNK